MRTLEAVLLISTLAVFSTSFASAQTDASCNKVCVFPITPLPLLPIVFVDDPWVEDWAYDYALTGAKEVDYRDGECLVHLSYPTDSRDNPVPTYEWEGSRYKFVVWEHEDGTIDFGNIETIMKWADAVCYELIPRS